MQSNFPFPGLLSDKESKSVKFTALKSGFRWRILLCLTGPPKCCARAMCFTTFSIFLINIFYFNLLTFCKCSGKSAPRPKGMRCRAWLEGTYCRNSTRSTFCHKHRYLAEYPSYISTLPQNIIATVAKFLATDCVQILRRTCKHMHQSIYRGHFFGTNEHKYFRRLFSKQTVTARQIVQAAQRYELLNKTAKDVLRCIPMHLKTIELPRNSDQCLISQNRQQIKTLLCCQ